MRGKKVVWIFALVSMFSSSLQLFAQQNLYSETEFNIPGQEASEAVKIRTFDGGDLICATTAAPSSWTNSVTFIKLDSAGSMQWTRRFMINCAIQQVVQCPDSSYLLAGEDGDNWTSFQLIKLDQNGTLIYNKRIRNIGYATLGPPLMLVRGNGNIYMGATVVDTINFDWHFQVFETDPDGNVLSSHIYHSDSLAREIAAIDTFANGDLLLVGTWMPSSTNSTQTSMLVDRIDSSWNYVWSKRIAAAGATGLRPWCAEKSSGDNFIISGIYIHPVPFGYEGGMTYLKIDGQGNVLSTYKYTDYVVQLGDILTNSSNEICVIGGDMGGQTNFLRIDSTGNLLNSRCFKNRYFTTMNMLPNGNLSLCGTTYPGKKIVLDITSPTGESCIDSNYIFTGGPYSTYSLPDSGMTPSATVVYTESPVTTQPVITMSVVCSTVDVPEIPHAEIDFHWVWEGTTLVLISSHSMKHVNVFDSGGRIVHSAELHSTNAELEFNCLPAGVYIVQIKADNGVATQKILKAN